MTKLRNAYGAGPRLISRRQLRRTRGGDDISTPSRSRPLTGMYGSAMTSGMGGQVRPKTGMFDSDW